MAKKKEPALDDEAAYLRWWETQTEEYPIDNRKISILHVSKAAWAAWRAARAYAAGADMRTGRLRGCPFCNGNAEMDYDLNRAIHRHRVRCAMCGASSEWCRTPDFARMLWNRRGP